MGAQISGTKKTVEGTTETFAEVMNVKVNDVQGFIKVLNKMGVITKSRQIRSQSAIEQGRGRGKQVYDFPCKITIDLSNMAGMVEPVVVNETENSAESEAA